MSNKLIDLNALSSYKTQSDLKYQDKLTAGTGISIDANNVISATGGGGGVTLPPAFAFNIQEPDFSATFSLNNDFSTAIANQQFSNYKLGAKLSIRGTYPGTLYLAEADYAYDTLDVSSHHVAALFVGATNKTINVQTASTASILTSIKGQIGNSHFVGCLGTAGGAYEQGTFSTSTFYPLDFFFLTNITATDTSQQNYSPVKYHKLALFNNYLRACKHVFDSSTKYSVRRNQLQGSSVEYYYMDGNSGSVAYTNSGTTQCAICGLILLK